MFNQYLYTDYCLYDTASQLQYDTTYSTQYVYTFDGMNGSQLATMKKRHVPAMKFVGKKQ